MLVANADPCWEDEGSLCERIYDWSGGNTTLANVSHWFIDRPLRILIVLVIAWILTRLTRRWVSRIVSRVAAPDSSPIQRLERLGIEVPDSLESGPTARREARAHSISVLLTSTLVVTIWSIAGMLILGIIGVNLGPLLAGAGIAGVAIGFGAQTLVRDVISGLFMMIEDQYGIGDVIDLGEAVGVVEDMSLRTTVLRGVDGTVWHVPNGVVQRVGNKSQLWSVAVVDVDVAYDSDLGSAKQILLDAANAVCEDERYAEQIYEPPEVLGVEALAADGITVRLIVRVKPGTQWEIQRRIREQLKQAFDDAGIEIPFPQRTVWMRTEADTAKGDDA